MENNNRHEILQAYGLTGLDELIYTNLENILTKYGKLFIGDKYIKDSASFHKCSEEEISKSVRHLKELGVIVKQPSKIPSANPLYGNYKVIAIDMLEKIIASRDSDMDAIDEIMNTEYKPAENKVTKLDVIDAACKDFLKDIKPFDKCNSLKDYLRKTFELYKRFYVDPFLFRNICRKADIEKDELENIITNINYEINTEEMILKGKEYTANEAYKLTIPKVQQKEVELQIDNKTVGYFEKYNDSIFTPQKKDNNTEFYIQCTCYVFNAMGIKITNHREYFNIFMRKIYDEIKQNYTIIDNNITVEEGKDERRIGNDKYVCRIQVAEEDYLKIGGDNGIKDGLNYKSALKWRKAVIG